MLSLHRVLPYLSWFSVPIYLRLYVLCFPSQRESARRQWIIKLTEQLIEAINNGDFEAYTYVSHVSFFRYIE